jgi:protein-ribulosamine 3-kinase
LGVCRNPRYKLGIPAIKEYQKHVTVSKPQADFDTRNAIYALKYHVLLSIMYFKDRRFHDMCVPLWLVHRAPIQAFVLKICC